jgi:hypothetical protein
LKKRFEKEANTEQEKVAVAEDVDLFDEQKQDLFDDILMLVS